MPGAFPPSHWEGIKLSQAQSGSGHAHTAACVAAAAFSTPGAAGYCILLHPPPAPGASPPCSQGTGLRQIPLHPVPTPTGTHTEAHKGGGTWSPTACPGQTPTMGVSPQTPGTLVCRAMIL